MGVLADLTLEERYLYALLQDQSGIDQAEFTWVDETSKDNVFRCWDYQYAWYRDRSKFQIDQCGRAVGKSVGMQMRAWAFPFTNPGEEMLLTAPEMIHLDPVTRLVEDRILNIRMSREFLKKSGTGNGITHRPFEARFRNGARIVGRIPQKDGKGVKGCIAEGTMILTRRGIIPVEEVIVGDLVFTHEHHWRPVLTTYRYEDADAVEVAGGGHRGLVMSTSHRMLTRRNRNPQRTRNLARPDWVILADEDDNEVVRQYLGTPCAFPSEDVPWPRFSADLAWVAGRYVADGYLAWQTKGGVRTSARVHVITDGARQGAVCDAFKRAYLRPTARLRENGTYDVEASDTDFCSFLLAHFGQHAESKTLPPWLLGAPEDVRRAFLDGYLTGDGHYDSTKRRWTAGTASKSLAVGLRLLAQSLGMSSGFSWVDPKVTHVMGRALKGSARRSWRVTMTEGGLALVDGDSMWQKIRKVTPTTATVYDLGVQEDHSYLADGLYSHNQHPKKLEMDEGQDYPEPGWVELGETLKYGEEDATWRTHGVSRGVRDRYYKQTQPESGWKVHRVTAMHRSDWGQAEREAKAELYGSRDHPDYRRNILGLHGDAQSALFVLSRLMECVDQRKESFYNTSEYMHYRISDERLRDSGMPISELLDFPAVHKAYERVWVGMDVGLTNHPSEILIFAEDTVTVAGKDKDKLPSMRLKLIARIHLERISSPDQREVLERVWDFYRPQAIAMDSTGLGLPIFQEITTPGKEGYNSSFAHVMRGYNFSKKIVVGYEELDDDAAWDDEPAPIEANVLEYSSDMLRVFVDQRKVLLPWDIDLIREFQGQTYVINKSSTDAYGRKRFNLGKFHALDGVRMALLGHLQETIDNMAKVQDETPVMDMFLV